MSISSPSTARLPLFLLSLCFLMAGSLAPAPAYAQFEWGKVGLTGGGNLERINDLRSSGVTASFESAVGDHILESAVGYHVGVTYDQSVGSVFIRPGFVARRAGTYTFPSAFEGPGHTLLQNQSFDVWVFELPVDVRYEYDLGRRSSVYLFAGPMLSFPRAEEDFDRAFPNAAIAADGGLGGEFDIPNAPLVVAPELRYSYGLTDTVKKDFQLRGRTFETDGLNLHGPSLRLHVYYPLDF